MSHPTFWPKKTFFYPIGNTPPVCLTDHLPPEGNATILLLGCGDPRNILYTVNVDHGAPNRTMDITCCDWEPAIIARNALIFTFIKDNIEPNRVLQYWSIFYDLCLDKEAAALLNEQCNKLVGYATDIATWAASPYGNFLKFATVDSLNETRRHWDSYRKTLGLSLEKQRELKQMSLAAMKAKSVTGGDASVIPSAAPLSFQFPSETCKTYTKYWKSGITNPNVGSHTPTQVNPTFLFSMAGCQFNLHYGTDPCSSFHLALALARVSFDGGPASTPAKAEHEMWEACRVQFSRWSLAFHKRLIAPNEASNIVIRLAVGDALAFCDGLQLCQTGDFTPTIYSSSWGAAKFSFHDQSMPTSFNVVDTSNLSDHLGLLNLVVAVRPLLQKEPHTVLHTNSLLSYKDHPTQRSALEERALLDFPTLALLLGITPLCYSSGLTFRNGSEGANFSALVTLGGGRHYERISWRFSDFAHAKWSGSSTQRNHEVRFHSADLGDQLFSVYLKMFENENFRSLFSQLHTGDISRTTIQNTHYHRQSFSRFLSVVRTFSCIKTDWPAAIKRFLDRAMLSKDLMVGSNNFQNLVAELHMRGVYSGSVFLPGYVSTHFGLKPIPFATWHTIPPVVCVVLKVPRAALKPLEEISADAVGHPILECETYHDFHNVHSSIRPIFGDVINSEDRKVIVEDPRGLNGDSPLIVSFFVASWILAAQPNELEIGLCIKSTPSDTATFASKLGLSLRLYSSKLLDQSNVFILPERPDNQGELPRIAAMNRSPLPAQDESFLHVTTVSFDRGTDTEVLSQKLDITEQGAKEALANKASVQVTQTTPSSMQVRIGNQSRYSLYYPIPVDGSQSKTRIARKSCYIEVDVPPRSSPLDQLTLQPFPMYLDTEGGRPRFVCWNAPYMNLCRFPSIASSEDSEWVRTHLGFCLSHRERALNSAPAEMWGPSMNFKSSIGNIFLNYAETKDKVCVLRDPRFQNPHAIIFLSSLRLDLSSATVVGDAVVIIPDPTMADLLLQCLTGSSIVTISIYGEEIRMWNHALPVFAERCRQWQHLPTCEYIQRQRVPLSVEYAKDPLCSCGKGQNLGPFLENSRWKPLAPHAIRIALTPIFPVTYLEDVTPKELLRGIEDGLRIRGVSPPSPAPVVQNTSGCDRCGGPGKPKLLKCGACQSAKYCSKTCQMADWKRHKRACKSAGKKST